MNFLRQRFRKLPSDRQTDKQTWHQTDATEIICTPLLGWSMNYASTYIAHTMTVQTNIVRTTTSGISLNFSLIKALEVCHISIFSVALLHTAVLLEQKDDKPDEGH